MFEFQWLWMFLLLPLPLLVRTLLKPMKVVYGMALKVPFIEDFQQSDTVLGLSNSKRLLIILAGLAWVALITASARPIWISDAVELPISGRDLMLAVDLSGSMQEQDFQLNGRFVDRLVATKSVAGEFIKRREGDRIGLILFGDQAYLQTPLTFDRKTVYTLLHESALGLAGEKTAIGDAIGLAVKRLRKQKDKQHILIIMTDGANTAGVVSPDEAATLAAQEGLKIYTVGIGSEQSRARGIFGLSMPNTSLDEKTLKNIAEITGGKYFRARDTQEFQQIYHELDDLEPVEKALESWRPQTELFRWPLLISLILFFSMLFLRKVIND